MTKRTLVQDELHLAFDTISSAQEAADDIEMVRSGEWIMEFVTVRDFSLVSLSRPECIDELEGQVICLGPWPVRSGELISRLPRPSGPGDELEGQVILWAHGPFDVVQTQFLSIQQMLYDRAASYGKVLGRISLADDIPNHWQQEVFQSVNVWFDGSRRRRCPPAGWDAKPY